MYRHISSMEPLQLYGAYNHPRIMPNSPLSPYGSVLRSTAPLCYPFMQWNTRTSWKTDDVGSLPNRSFGKQRRCRTAFSQQQLAALEQAFSENQYPDLDVRDELSRRTAVAEPKIQVWFKNRRAKERKQNKAANKSKDIICNPGKQKCSPEAEKSTLSSDKDRKKGSHTAKPKEDIESSSTCSERKLLMDIILDANCHETIPGALDMTTSRNSQAGITNPSDADLLGTESPLPLTQSPMIPDRIFPWYATVPMVVGGFEHGVCQRFPYMSLLSPPLSHSMVYGNSSNSHFLNQGQFVETQLPLDSDSSPNYS